MTFDMLLFLKVQAKNLCNRLFSLLLSTTDPQRIDKLCRIFDRAADRLYRREQLAGLLPIP